MDIRPAYRCIKGVMRMTGVRRLGVLSLCLFLLLPGCASVPAGESVYPLTRDSVPPELLRMAERGVPIGNVNGTRITRKDGDTYSASANYLAGLLQDVPKGKLLGTYAAQLAPRLQVAFYANGKTCAAISEATFEHATAALRATLAEADNPAPPGIVEIHLLGPEYGVSSVTLLRETGDRIHLKYYFHCLQRYQDLAVMMAVSGTLHELSHAAFQWRGGVASEEAASGAEMCLRQQLQASPLHSADFSYFIDRTNANLRMLLGKPEDAALDAPVMCKFWQQSMHALEQPAAS